MQRRYHFDTNISARLVYFAAGAMGHLVSSSYLLYPVPSGHDDKLISVFVLTVGL